MKKYSLFQENNLDKHGISIFEAEEALLDGWRSRRQDGDHYEVLGRTQEGRYLQLLVESQEESIRVFHGRNMTATERRRYKRK